MRALLPNGSTPTLSRNALHSLIGIPCMCVKRWLYARISRVEQPMLYPAAAKSLSALSLSALNPTQTAATVRNSKFSFLGSFFWNPSSRRLLRHELSDRKFHLTCHNDYPILMSDYCTINKYFGTINRRIKVFHSTKRQPAIYSEKCRLPNTFPDIKNSLAFWQTNEIRLWSVSRQ